MSCSDPGASLASCPGDPSGVGRCGSVCATCPRLAGNQHRPGVLAAIVAVVAAVKIFGRRGR